jgi:hypothetical protein
MLSPMRALSLEIVRVCTYLSTSEVFQYSATIQSRGVPRKNCKTRHESWLRFPSPGRRSNGRLSLSQENGYFPYGNFTSVLSFTCVKRETLF